MGRKRNSLLVSNGWRAGAFCLLLPPCRPLAPPIPCLLACSISVFICATLRFHFFILPFTLITHIKQFLRASSSPSFSTISFFLIKRLRKATVLVKFKSLSSSSLDLRNCFCISDIPQWDITSTFYTLIFKRSLLHAQDVWPARSISRFHHR